MTPLSTPAPTTTMAPLWRNRDYMVLWLGQVISSTGSQISLVALPLLILAITHSPAQAGIVTALRGVPYALLCLHAGALVDRWNRKRVMILCDAGRAVALGSIPLALSLGRLTLGQLYGVAVIEGTLFLFFTMAEAACIPQVVGREQITAALAQNNTADSMSMLLGQAVSGALFTIGSAIPFLADALSYVASVGSLSLIKTRFQEERVATTQRLWAEIGEGIGWLWRQPVLRFIALLTCGLTTFSSGYAIIVIVLAQERHATTWVIGLIFATGGIGSILGGVLAPWLKRRWHFGHVMIGAAWIWALTWLFYAIAPDALWLGIANALAFIIVPIYMTTQYSYRLTITPDRLQGRVNSVFRLIAFGSQPIGIVLTGVLVQSIGPVWSVLIITSPQLALAIVATLYRPLRRAS